jgi:hypothetical protein
MVLPAAVVAGDHLPAVLLAECRPVAEVTAVRPAADGSLPAAEVTAVRPVAEVTAVRPVADGSLPGVLPAERRLEVTVLRPAATAVLPATVSLPAVSVAASRLHPAVLRRNSALRRRSRAEPSRPPSPWVLDGTSSSSVSAQ